MNGIGIVEILLILLTVILFVKPKDLPVFFYKTGKFYRHIKDHYERFTAHLREMEWQMNNPYKKDPNNHHKTPESDSEKDHYSENINQETPFSKCFSLKKNIIVHNNSTSSDVLYDSAVKRRKKMKKSLYLKFKQK